MLLLIRALPHLASPLLSRTPQVNSRPVAIPAMAGPGAIKKVPTDRQSGSPNSRRDTRPAPVRVSARFHPPQSPRVIVRRVKSRPLSRFLDATADHAPTDDILCSMRRERPQPWASSYASSSSVRPPLPGPFRPARFVTAWKLTLSSRLQVLQGPPHPSVWRLLLHLHNRPKWRRKVQLVSCALPPLPRRAALLLTDACPVQHGRHLVRPGYQVVPPSILASPRPGLPRPGDEDVQDPRRRSCRAGD